MTDTERRPKDTVECCDFNKNQNGNTSPSKSMYNIVVNLIIIKCFNTFSLCQTILQINSFHQSKDNCLFLTDKKRLCLNSCL